MAIEEDESENDPVTDYMIANSHVLRENIDKAMERFRADVGTSEMDFIADSVFKVELQNMFIEVLQLPMKYWSDWPRNLLKKPTLKWNYKTNGHWEAQDPDGFWWHIRTNTDGIFFAEGIIAPTRFVNFDGARAYCEYRYASRK